MYKINVVQTQSQAGPVVKSINDHRKATTNKQRTKKTL